MRRRILGGKNAAALVLTIMATVPCGKVVSALSSSVWDQRQPWASRQQSTPWCFQPDRQTVSLTTVFPQPCLVPVEEGSDVAVLPNAITNECVRSWNADARALYHAGFGDTAGVAGEKAILSNHNNNKRAAIRKGVHQIWLQMPQLPPLQTFVGNLDGRRDLHTFVERLRRELGTLQNINLPPSRVELSYLVYDNTGAYYNKHVDAIRDGTNKRRISFVIYLGGFGNDQGEQEELPWDVERDGGALRIHSHPTTTTTSSSSWDVAPHPGTMVVFDSRTVWHEVCPVYRKRVCVVGWFGTDC